MILKNTISICPACGIDVPATILEIEGMAIMRKTCPEHGLFNAVVERDAEFYKLYDHPENKIFDGFFIDVTGKCNLECSYCYHPKGEHVKKEDILAEAALHDCPIYLAGGEPTLRPDLPEIVAAIKQKVYIPTNGTGLLDADYMNRLFSVIGVDDGYKGIALSYHSEYPALFETVMETIKEQEHKITSAIFTITHENQLADCLKIADKWQDYIFCFRVHCATPLWASESMPLFLSDVIKHFDGETLPALSKTIWAIGVRNSKVWAFCHWDTVGTIEIDNTSCGPYTRANDGKIYHLTEGFIRNGMSC